MSPLCFKSIISEVAAPTWLPDSCQVVPRAWLYLSLSVKQISLSYRVTRGSTTKKKAVKTKMMVLLPPLLVTASSTFPKNQSLDPVLSAVSQPSIRVLFE